MEDKNPARNNGYTPLHAAAEFGRLEVFELLKRNAQDKNPAANDGVTPQELVDSFCERFTKIARAK